MADKLKRFSGRVIKKPWGGASKSAHEAVCLQTEGASFKLRRAGANPFVDDELEALVGKEIQAEGKLIEGSTVLISSWRELPSG